MEQTAQMLLSAWQLSVRRNVHTVCRPRLIIVLMFIVVKQRARADLKEDALGFQTAPAYWVISCGAMCCINKAGNMVQCSVVGSGRLNIKRTNVNTSGKMVCIIMASDIFHEGGTKKIQFPAPPAAERGRLRRSWEMAFGCDLGAPRGGESCQEGSTLRRYCAISGTNAVPRTVCC